MRRAVVATAVVLTCVALGEGALRAAGFGRGIRYRPHARLGWEMVPGQRAFNVRGRAPVRTNSLGFRGPELEVPKPPDRDRILFLGDGATLNNQTREERTFPFLVAERLRRERAPRSIDVAVGAVSSYQLEQELELLRLLGERLAPNTVVVGFCWNDWETTQMRGPGLGPLAYGELAGPKSWVERTALHDFGARVHNTWVRRRQQGAIARGEGLPNAADDEARWLHVGAMLDSIDAVARRCCGADVVLLVLPAALTDSDRTAYASRKERLRSWCERAGALFVDPEPAFAAARSSGVAPFLDHLHLSPAAQPLVADALGTALASHTPATRKAAAR